MGAQQYGFPAVREFPEQFAQGKTAPRIQAVGRLIQHQELGVVNQGACQRESLLHALRKFRDQTVPPLKEADAPQKFLVPKARVAAAEPEATRKEAHIFEYGHIVIGSEAVGDKADQALCLLRALSHIDTAHQKLPRIRCE